MAISNIPTRPAVNPADIPLEKMVQSKALPEADKATEMTRQFEAMLLRQILTQAQKPMLKSGQAPTGVSNDIYKDMMVNQMAETISSTRSLGLGRELEAQLTRQLRTDAPPAPGSAPNKTEISTPAPAGPPIHLTKVTR